MSRLHLNLARRPFLNRRPVRRFVVVAWIVGVLLLAFNVLLWVRDRQDSTELRARLADTAEAVEVRSQAILDSSQRSRNLGLARQNAQVDFLNYKIEQRTFPWSVLFDRIGGVLPDGVLLNNLSPSLEDHDPRRAGNRVAEEEVEDLVGLSVSAEARTEEDLYQLVDALFAHPAFQKPRLFRETTNVDGTVSFNMDVQYRPRLEEEPTKSLEQVRSEEELAFPEEDLEPRTAESPIVVFEGFELPEKALEVE